MKKIFVCIVLFVYNCAFSQYKYVLEGKLQNSTISKMIYLEIRDNYSLKEYIKKDSCVIKNGLFRFSGELNKKSEVAKLYFTDEDAFRFVMDKGLNVISFGEVIDSSKSYFSNTKRPVSVSNEMYSKQDSLYKIYFDKYATDVKTYTIEKPHEIKMVKMLNNYEMGVELRKRQLEIVKDYPNSFYSLIFLYQSLHHNPYVRSPSVLFEIFKDLDYTIKNDLLGVEFYKICNEILIAEKESKPEQKVPNFTIKTDKGEMFTNTSLLGKPYIIAFSATWCAPCKLMEPKLKLLFDNYKSKGLEVVYFNFDGDDKKWKEHISKNNFNWINVSDGLKPDFSPISKQFNVRGIPHYLVVDRKGTIIYNSNVPMDSNFLMLEKNVIKAIE